MTRLKTKGTSPLYQKGVLIPAGKYRGTWSANMVDFIHADHVYTFFTEHTSFGVIPVDITVTVTERGHEITVETIGDEDD